MSFDTFYERWNADHRRLVDQLRTAPKPPKTPEDNQILSALLNRAMDHHHEYYRVKKLTADRNVLSLFSSPWSSSLERSLQWVAGYRPTTVFHLIYTESSILFESRIVDILRGHRTGDLGDISPSQLSRISELQCETVREENEIAEELSAWQDDASDLVKLSTGVDGGDDIEGKIGRLGRIVDKADDLRLRTIKRVVEVLTPHQAVEFLIAAAELQFGVRGWGIDRDRERGFA